MVGKHLVPARRDARYCVSTQGDTIMAGKHSVAGKTIFSLIISFLCISHLCNHLSAGQDVSSDDIAISKPISASRPKATSRKAIPKIVHKGPERAAPIVDTDKDALLQQRGKKAWENVPGRHCLEGTKSILRVPGDYPTIQAAIDAAADGDTIVVSAGTYKETLRILSKDITLQGEDKESTTINGKYTDKVSVIYISGGKVHISGFTIKNGDRDGVHLLESEGCIITNNIIKDNNSYGIGCYDNSGLTITGNLVEANGELGILVVRSSGSVANNIIKENKEDGVDCYDNPSLTIMDNLIEANGEDGLFIVHSSCSITNNTIKKNGDSGIQCQDSSDVTVTDNSIAVNSGPGLAFFSFFSGSLTGNTLMDNAGGGILLIDVSNVKISENYFKGNKEDGIYMSVCNGIEITRNEIIDTILSNRYGEGIFAKETTALIKDNIIKSSATDGLEVFGVNSVVETIDNTITDNLVNGIYCESGVTITGCCNTVTNNGTNFSGCTASLAACPCPVGGAGDTLSITPSSVVLTRLDTQAQLTAIVEGKNGATLNVTGNAAWSSSNTSIAIVDNKGLIIAIGNGEAEVCAEYNTLHACVKVTTNTIHFGINQWTQNNKGKGLGIINDIVIDPIDTNIIYAATWEGKIFKSFDNGEDWQEVTNGLGGDTINALAIVPTNHEVLYAGSYANIYKSVDGGENWSDIARVNDASNIVIDFLNTDTIYAGSGSGMLKSVDGGKTWAKINTGLTYTHIFEDALVMDPLNPEILYVIVTERGADGKVFKTTNGGMHWHEIGNGLPDTVSCIAIDPINPKVLYAGTFRGGNFKTTDAGNTWYELAGSPHENNWVIKVSPKNPGVLYVGNAGQGVYESRDGGKSWHELFTQLTSRNIYALAINQKHPTVFAGSSSGKFRFKSAFEEVKSGPNDDGTSINSEYIFNTDTGIDPIGFNVYRSVSAQGDFEKITDTLLGPNVTSFHDADFLDGATHVYKMTVGDADGETLPSFTSAAKPLLESNPDYAIDAAEAEKPVSQGGSVVFPLTVSSHDNFDEDVTFEAADLPAGATAVFTPTNGVPPLAVSMNVSTTTTTSPGSYDITVKAKGDDVIRTTTVRLNVGVGENKITQSINATDVAVGKAVEITGEISPATGHGEQVTTTFVSPDNETSNMTAETDSGGRYSIVKTFEKSGIWKITTTWEEGYTSSPTAELFVAQTVTAIVMATDATPKTEIGDTLTLKGKISPNPGGGDISLEIDNLDGSIQFNSLVAVSPEGEFSYRVKVVGDEAGGDIRINARFDGTGEYGPGERTIFVPIKRPPGMAIIVAGGSNEKSGELWNQTNTICNYVYTVIKNQGIPDDLTEEGKNRIYYLHPDANNDADNDGVADTDAKPTRANLQKAIQEWALGLVAVGNDAKKTVTPITVYMMGTGEDDKFGINKTETVTAKDLSGWLNQLFTAVKKEYMVDTLPVNVILESPQSGSFIDDLKVKEGVGNGRGVVTSTDDGSEDTGGEINVMGDGAVSFSKQFFYGVKSGRSIGTSWADANLTIQELFDNQSPQMDADGNGISNEEGDEIRGRLAFINQNMSPKEETETGMFDQVRDGREVTLDAQSFVINQRPIVTGVQKDLTVEKQTATLWAKVSDADDAIEDLTVQGLLFPPKGKEPVELELSYSEENDRFEISTDGFGLFGLYTALFVAKDKQGNASRIGKTAVNSQSILPVILKGTVYDSVTKRPIDRAVVAIEGGYGNITTANGGIYLIQLPAGVYTISASKKRYVTGSIKYFTVSGGSVTKDIELTPRRKQ